MGPGFYKLWPTPIGIYRYPEAAAVNPKLLATFNAIRGPITGPFFASPDDLLHRIKLDEWSDFVSFIVDGIGETARRANREAWAGQSLDLTVGLEGVWFQISQGGAFHDVHTHGNCSWSGVYIVQIDDSEDRVEHPVYGAANGVTRLYGPPFSTLGGAFVDVGNAYLQPPSHDIEPVAGQLLVFPSWLAHQALPYVGAKDRVIVSFNASIHSAGGDQMHGYSAT